MSNKINGLEPRPAAPVTASTKTGREGVRDSATADPSSGQSAAKVSITDAARQLATLEAAVAAVPVVDQARVDAINSDLDQGRYAIDPQQIADKLLRFEREMGPVPAKPESSQE